MALTLQQMSVLFSNDPMKQRLITSFLEGSESVVLPDLYFVDSNEMLGYTFSQVNDLGDVSERSLNGQYTISDAKASPKHITLALFGGATQTDNVVIDSKGETARLIRIDKRMIAMGKYFDDMFINGDTQANPRQFTGLRKRSELKNRVLWTGTNGGPLTLNILDEALDAVSGDNTKKTIYCDRYTRRQITIAVRGAATGSNTMEVQTQVQSYNGARIKTISENHKFAPVFAANEKRGSATTCRSLYVTRLGGSQDEEGVQGIKGPTFMKLRQPVNMGEFVKDVIDNVLGIEDFGDFAFMRIGGILAAA